jgi:ABC-type multidrug transport system permease subunit
MNRKLVISLSLMYVLFMGALSIYYYTADETFKSLVSIGGVVCGAIPLSLALFTISYLIFLFASQFLGSILGWYGLGWWDTFLHLLSGSLLAFTGIALYERLVYRNAGKEISPWFVFLFTLSFSALGGVIWEIYEFSSDQLFGMTLQGGGNKDTMIDLIADTIGGLIIAVWAGVRTKIKLKKI